MNSVVGNTLPDGWEEKKLGEVLDNILTGTTPSKREPKYYENPTVNWFSPSDFGVVKVLEDAKNKVSQLAIDERKAKLYEEDSLLLVAIGATVGKVAIARKKVSSNQQITALKFMPHIDVDFAYHYFIFIKPMVVKTASAATMPIINQKAIKSLTIPLPPLEEQKRIVAKIDTLFAKIDKAISLTEESLKQAKNLLPSVLKEVFEKEKIKIGDVSLSTVVDILSGVSLPKLFKGVTKRDGNIPYYKVAQMNNDSYIMKGALLKFSATEAKQYKIKLFPKGTVLFPKRGGAILTNKKRVLTEDASYDSNTMGLKAKNNFISDEYLFTVLRNIDLSDYIDESTIPQINNKHIDRMRIVLTDLERQKEIVAISDAVGKSSRQTQSKLEEQLAYLKKLKSSILSKTFQGEL